MAKTPNQARDELVRAREQLLQRLQAVHEDAIRNLAPLSADSADRAQEQENDEVLDRIDRSTMELLAQYRRAIERIDAGQYGICEECGFEIGASRLAAVPQATLCAECMGARRAA